MNNRIMILGSLDEFVKLTEMAKERGIYTVVCDGNPDGPAKKIADAAYDLDVRDTDAIAEVCRKEQVDGILTAFSDLLLECMVNIAAKAGLPCYLTPEQAVYYRDKSVMKNMFHKIGVPTPQFLRLKPDFTDGEVKGFPFPAVTKPIDKYGSRGLFVVNSAEEIRSCFEKSCESSDIKEILLEEYNTGYEFNLMSYVHEGQVYVLGLADREKTKINPASIPISTRNVYPSCLMDHVYDDARAILQKVIAFTGQTEGELSMQFFWAADRGIQVCEVAARFLGYEHELIEYCSSLSLEELMLDSVYDTDAFAKKLAAHDPWFKKVSAVLYFQGKEDVIADLSIAKDCLDLPEIVSSQLFYEDGEKITAFARPYVARCCISSDSRLLINIWTDRIFDGMSITNAKGEELLYQNQRTMYPDCTDPDLRS